MEDNQTLKKLNITKILIKMIISFNLLQHNFLNFWFVVVIYVFFALFDLIYKTYQYKI